MRPKVIHEKVVSVVDKEVKRVKHLLIVAYQRHLQVLVNHLLQLLLSFVFLVNQLDLPLLLRLFKQEFRVANDFI